MFCADVLTSDQFWDVLPEGDLVVGQSFSQMGYDKFEAHSWHYQELLNDFQWDQRYFEIAVSQQFYQSRNVHLDQWIHIEHLFIGLELFLQLFDCLKSHFPVLVIF
jgi:hypothetical protein